MNKGFVTISIDDGHPTDLRTAEVLSKYGLAATFYIPRTNTEREVISLPHIRALARQFEVGGHTLNHVHLRAIHERRAWTEIRDGKDWLEQVIGEPVASFCYPWGKFNRRIVTMVRNAGFVGARTCFINLHSFPQNPFLWGVSTQAWPHSKMMQLRHALFERNLLGALNFLRVYKGATDWQEHFLHALDYVELHGGVAHMSLHSWEIDAHSEWQKLEMVLKVVAERKMLTSLSNGALFRLWKVLNSQQSQKSQLESSPLEESAAGSPGSLSQITGPVFPLRPKPTKRLT